MIQIKNRYSGAVILEVNAASLSGANLRSANLRSADLSTANLLGANLSTADLSGANLWRADLRSANLQGANLSGADLSGADLWGANLRSANLQGADLSGANLSTADLSGANLSGASLSGANLSGASLPETLVVDGLDAKIHAAVCGPNAPGKLDMESWHACETTHCRAGWATHLAGTAGRDLEAKLGPCAAGAIIYHCSTGRVPNFYASNTEALREICELAGEKMTDACAPSETKS